MRVRMHMYGIFIIIAVLLCLPVLASDLKAAESNGPVATNASGARVAADFEKRDLDIVSPNMGQPVLFAPRDPAQTWWPYAEKLSDNRRTAPRVEEMDESLINIHGGVLLDVNKEGLVLSSAPQDLILEEGMQLASSSGFYLVKIEGRDRTEEQINQLQEAGAILGEYINLNTYIATIPSDKVGTIQTMPFVTYVGDYHPLYKISPSIGTVKVPVEIMYEPAWRFEVVLHKGADMKTVLDILAAKGIVVKENDIVVNDVVQTVFFDMEPKNVVEIAKIPEVKWICEASYHWLHASSSSPAVIPMVLQNNGTFTTATSTGWKLWNAGIDGNASGTAQVITMMDTGLNTKMEHFAHDMTNPAAAPSTSHRKVVGYEAKGGGDTCVLNYYTGDGGHGTWTSQHAAGSIPSGSSHTPVVNYANGPAKDAKINFQDVGTSAGTLSVPATLTESIQDAQNNYGSYIQNHSWGGATGYDTQTSTLDNDLHDTYTNFVVTVSAGNEIGTANIGTPATAKNVICVGGVNVSNPNQVFQDETWGLGSSQGPAGSYSRIKPDVCAYMASSGLVGSENMAGERPSAMCQADATRNVYWDWINNSGLGGTSFSAPQVAGLAALVRDYFLAGFYPSGTAGGTTLTPSASLVKAVILASCENTTGFGPDVPNTFTYRYSNATGYGRVNLPSVLRIGSSAPYLWVKNSLNMPTSGTHTYTYSIKGNDMPLRIMLVWNDDAGDALQRNLNLRATIGATTYYGNNFSTTGWTNTGTTVDASNNTEGIFLNAAAGLPSSGTVTVTVLGASSGSENYSLVISGNVFDDATQVYFDNPVKTCIGPLVTTVRDSNASSPVSVTIVSRDSGGTTIDTETVSCAGSDGFFTNTIQMSGTNSAGILYVLDGGTITATYNDTNPVGTYTYVANIDCQLAADDGGFIIEGGCDNYVADFEDPVAGPLYNSSSNEYYTSYMDAGEYTSYTFGFVNRCGFDLTDCRVALSFSGAGASYMTCYNSPVNIGAVPADTLGGAAFQVFTAAGTPGLTMVNMDFSITSPADGLTTPLVLTQVQPLQTNDTITRNSYCQTFTGDITGYTEQALVNNNPWRYVGNNTVRGENRTDGDCDNATTGVAMVGSSGTTNNFAASAFSYLVRSVQPANTGNAPNGQPWYYATKWHSFYGSAEVYNNTSGVWGLAYYPEWDRTATPTASDMYYDAPWSLGPYYHTAVLYNLETTANWDWETANTGTPDDPAAGPPNQWYVTIPDYPIQATTDSYWAWGQMHADSYWFTGTSATRRDIAIDNDRFVYDQFYAASQSGTSCSTTQVGQISLDKFVYSNCPEDTVTVSVLDSNASSPITAVVTSAFTGDSETVTLTGSAPYFSATLAISLNDGLGANNGILYVGGSDTLTATYTDTNPAGSTVTSAYVECANGDVVYTSNTQISDNGDNDGYPDNNETVVTDITITNNMATDLTNAKVTIFTVDPDILCIIDNTANYGTVSAGASQTNPTSDRFSFQVNPSTACTDWQAPPNATFDVVITGDDFYGSSSRQTFALNLDLDTYSGTGYTYTQDFSTDPGWSMGATADDDGGCTTTAYINEFAYRPDGHASGNGAYGAWMGTGGTFSGVTGPGIDAYDSSTLYSPVFIAGGSVTLAFDVAYRFNAYTTAYHGCKVQYSVDGGTWTNLDFTTPAQSATYNSNQYCSPLHNTATIDNAWFSSTGQTWTTTNAASVTATAGQTVQFRWRSGTDSGGDSAGGYGVDNVTVTNLAQTVQCEPTTNSGLPDNCGGCSQPTTPVISDITDDDACAQDGVTITFTGGSPSTSHVLVVNGTEVASDISSPYQYNPGTTSSRDYQVRTYCDTYSADSAVTAFVDANNTPGAPTITAVNDVDVCAQSGVQIVYTAGSGAASHDLYDNGTLAVTGYASGATYNPGDTSSHNYVVRAINGTCYTDSNTQAGTDANNTPGQPVITLITDLDPNNLTGITVAYTAGSGAVSHDLYRNGVSVVTNYVSGATYLPGDNTTYTYTVVAVNGTCTNVSAGVPGTDAYVIGCTAPTQEVIETVITDKSGFNWTATDATSYRVSRGVLANLAALNTTSTDFSCYGTTTGTTISISGDDPSVETGRCYYYLIQGYNGTDPNTTTCMGPGGNSTAGARSIELAVACP